MQIVKIFDNMTTSRKLITGFLGATLIGTIFLMMPFSLREGQQISFLTSLFTIASAICVTGLSLVDVSQVFSPVGDVIIMIFIQLGGLGVMTFSSLILFVAGKKLTYHNRMLLKDERNTETGELKEFIFKIIKTILVIEGIGAIILAMAFKKELDITPAKALFYGIFHSVSAFCNAGFSLFSDGLMPFAKNVTINLTVMYLIILGGLGFALVNSYILVIRKNISRFDLTSRLSIIISIILTFFGALIFFAFEYTNPNTIGQMSFGNKIMASFFQSVTTRTAGFNTVDIGALQPRTIFMFFGLMFIGASPGSTGGGIKTTTIGVLAFYIISVVRGKEHVQVLNRRVGWEILNKAISIFVISILFVGIIVMLILSFENFTMAETIFEVISAFATVGLSLGITAKLSISSQLLIIITMFFGRLGPMTFALALGEKKEKETLEYPKENILIG